MRKKILLLGNGINRVDNSFSWEDLMNGLLDFAGLDSSISMEGKSFPMLYEEMYLRWVQHGGKKESDIKRIIRKLIGNITPNELHRRAVELSVDEILTTNYDYNLEMSVVEHIKEAPHLRPVKGTKYSILRRRQVANKLIWHIHGEIGSPGSILLGYEQYAGYLQYIRNYVVNGISYSDLSFSPLNKRLKQGDGVVRAWIDHFFLNDIYILGLSMDFVEMHLWWLLDFRARISNSRSYDIQNKIVYMYPQQDQSWMKNRLDLLCACNVDAIPIPISDFKQLYHSAMDFIEADGSRK